MKIEDKIKDLIKDYESKIEKVNEALSVEKGSPLMDLAFIKGCNTRLQYLNSFKKELEQLLKS